MISQPGFDEIAFKRALFNEFNLIRTNPRLYAEKIKAKIPYIQDNVLRLPGKKIGIRLEEGIPAFEEAVNFLNSVNPVPPLKYNIGLGNVAEEYAKLVKNASDMEQLDAIDFQGILDKYGEYSGNVGRSMDFGSTDAEGIMTNLIVCDGDLSRGQRNTIFNDSYTCMAVSTTLHDIYERVNVIVACTEYEVFKGVVDVGNSIMNNSGNSKVYGGNEDDEPANLDEDVKTMKVNERIVMENGRKIKITKTIKEHYNGEIETETIKEVIG